MEFDVLQFFGDHARRPRFGRRLNKPYDGFSSSCCGGVRISTSFGGPFVDSQRHIASCEDQVVPSPVPAWKVAVRVLHLSATAEDYIAFLLYSIGTYLHLLRFGL
jgi:hypothetical protein